MAAVTTFLKRCYERTASIERTAEDAWVSARRAGNPELTRPLADGLLDRLHPRFYRWLLRRAWLKLRAGEPVESARSDVARAIDAYRPTDPTPASLPGARQLLKRFDAGEPHPKLQRRLGELLRRAAEGPMPHKLIGKR